MPSLLSRIVAATGKVAVRFRSCAQCLQHHIQGHAESSINRSYVYKQRPLPFGGHQLIASRRPGLTPQLGHEPQVRPQPLRLPHCLIQFRALQAHAEHGAQGTEILTGLDWTDPTQVSEFCFIRVTQTDHDKHPHSGREVAQRSQAVGPDCTCAGSPPAQLLSPSPRSGETLPWAPVLPEQGPREKGPRVTPLTPSLPT